MSNTKTERRRARRETASTIQAPNQPMSEIVDDRSTERPSVRSLELEYRYER